MQAFIENRLHHAWLISGPEGIGKSLFAMTCAQFLLDQQGAALISPDSLDISPESQTSKLVASNAHPDLKVIARAFDEKNNRYKQEISVDQVRENVSRFMSMTPSLSEWRVVIVDAADDLNRNAANALLKVLEEPPKKAILFLLSHNPGRLLPTIRSRCRQIKLNPLNDEDMLSVTNTHNVMIDPPDQPAVLRLADGRPGVLMKLMSEGGFELYQQFISLLCAYPNFSYPEITVFSQQLSKKDDLDKWQQFEGFVRHFAQRLVKHHASGAPFEAVLGKESELVSRFTANAQLLDVITFLDHASTLFNDVKRINSDKKQAVIRLFTGIQQWAA